MLCKIRLSDQLFVIEIYFFLVVGSQQWVFGTITGISTAHFNQEVY